MSAIALDPLWRETADKPRRRKSVFEDAITEAQTRYGDSIGEGRFRITFDRGDGTVLKLPKGWYAEGQNMAEASEYLEPTFSKGWPLAHTEAINFEGVFALVQEYARAPNGSTREVGWATPRSAANFWRGVRHKSPGAQEHDDSYQQIGVTPSGQWKVFDFAQQ